MKLPSSFPRLKGFRFPREIVAYAVWAYHRFALSTADVEDLLAERGVIISRETVRLWINRFAGSAIDDLHRIAKEPNLGPRSVESHHHGVLIGARILVFIANYDRILSGGSL